MKFLQTFKEHYLWIEINNSFNQRKQIFFMWSITFVVLSYNENPDSRSSVNPDNIPLQVHPKVLLYKITHIQCQSWIAFWRTRIVSLLLVKIYTYWYTCIWLCTSIIWMPLSYMYMTIPFTYIVILRMTFTMMGWYGCFLLNICCHNSSLHTDSAGIFVYFYRYLLLFWFFHANDTGVIVHF